MPDATPTPVVQGTTPGATPGAQPQPQPREATPPPHHHSARQPRDDGKRFAGPPSPTPETAKPQEGQPPPAPAKLKGKYKENGQEVEEEATEAELWEDRRRLRALQYERRESQERLRRAGELANEAADAKAVAKAMAEGKFDTLREFFARNNAQPVEVLGNLLEAALNERDMDPKDRELAQLRSEKAQLEAERQQQQESVRAERFNQDVAKHREGLHRTLGALLERQDLPKTEEMLEKASEIYLASIDATEGKAPLSFEQVADLTRWQLVDATAKPVINSLEVPQFLRHFGGEGSILSKLDASLSPEDFERTFPALARRFHQDLIRRARSSRTHGAVPKQPTPAPRTEAEPSEPGALDPWLAGRISKRG
jgi:hypothetical protein